jgi:hypothetical protein
LKVRATREAESLSESGLIWKVQSTVSGEEFVGKMNEIKYGDGKMKRILGSDFFFFLVFGPVCCFDSGFRYLASNWAFEEPIAGY